MTTLGLHAGIREETALEGRILDASDALETWLDGDDGATWIEAQASLRSVVGLRGFARQLGREMVVLIADG